MSYGYIPGQNTGAWSGGTGGSGMNPMWFMAGGQALSTYNQPDPPEQLPGNLVATDPRQFAFYGDMLNAYRSGAGDYGFGSTMKSGLSQMDQFYADRGISQDSGAYLSGLTDLVAQAQAYDAANRWNYGMSLLNSPPSTAIITGENMVPGAAEAGYGGRSELSEFLKQINSANSGLGLKQIPNPYEGYYV